MHTCDVFSYRRPKNIPEAFGGQPIPEGGVTLAGDKEWLQKYENVMVRACVRACVRALINPD